MLHSYSYVGDPKRNPGNPRQKIGTLLAQTAELINFFRISNGSFDSIL
jgi:hypothetical protein